MKFLPIICLMGNGIGTWLQLQVVPQVTSKSAMEAYLIAAIVGLVTALSVMWVYSKNVNAKVDKIYQGQISDLKDIIKGNTQVISDNTSMSKESVDATKKTADALVEIRVLLNRVLKLGT